jgi:hypothetical protein
VQLYISIPPVAQCPSPTLMRKWLNYSPMPII